MTTSIESVRWRLWACSETPASLCVSASCYHFTKDVRILAVVMAEGELRQILAAYVMKRADDATFEQSPERFDRIGVDLAAHIFARLMIDGFMAIAQPEPAIASPFIRCDQFYFVRNHLAHESIDCLLRSILDNLTNDI